MVKRTLDGHPAAMKKPAVLARSGVFMYTYDEMVERGFTPKDRREGYAYSEYRSPAVVVRSRDLYQGTTVTIGHTEDETHAGNFHDPNQRVTGVVGENIEVDTLPDDNVCLNGNIYFYTQDGVKYYDAGNKETSGDLKSKVRVSKDPKYDFECVEILSVNGVVLTERGRGGPNVRVQDSTKTASSVIGGFDMKKGFFGIFGFGRTQDDASFKLSKVLMEEVKKVNIADPKSVEAGIGRVFDSMGSLGENKTRDLLVGAVAECFAHPVEAAANEKTVSEQVDKLYTKCRTLDAEELKKTMDALDTEESTEMEDELDGEGKKVPKKKEDKETKSKDSATIIEEAVTKALARVTDSVSTIVDAAILKRFGAPSETPEAKAAREKKEKETGRTTDAFQAAVDAAVAKQLGLAPGGHEVVVDGRTDERTLDSLDNPEDAGFILKDVFGQ